MLQGTGELIVFRQWEQNPKNKLLISDGLLQMMRFAFHSRRYSCFKVRATTGLVVACARNFPFSTPLFCSIWCHPQTNCRLALASIGVKDTFSLILLIVALLVGPHKLWIVLKSKACGSWRGHCGFKCTSLTSQKSITKWPQGHSFFSFQIPKKCQKSNEFVSSKLDILQVSDIPSLFNNF